MNIPQRSRYLSLYYKTLALIYVAAIFMASMVRIGETVPAYKIVWQTPFQAVFLFGVGMVAAYLAGKYEVKP